MPVALNSISYLNIVQSNPNEESLLTEKGLYRAELLFSGGILWNTGKGNHEKIIMVLSRKVMLNKDHIRSFFCYIFVSISCIAQRSSPLMTVVESMQ